MSSAVAAGKLSPATKHEPTLGRARDAMRPVSLEPGVGLPKDRVSRTSDTHVLCTASVEERVPPFLRNTGKGWVTAEYGMLPRSTATRTE